MLQFLAQLFDTADFPRRWECGNWTAGHGWLHILSDLAVWSAYFTIPCILAYFVLRRRDVPFPTIFWLFGAFILACGTTHLMEAIIFWHPVYRLAGVIKLLTAIVSWGTVAALVPTIPKALALRSPADLEHEIAARKKAEDALQRANADLEARVRERTEELEQANASLRRNQEIFTLAHHIGKVGHWEWNSVTDENKWSPEIEALYGLEPGTFAGTYEAWSKLLHPDDRGKQEEVVRRAFETGEYFTEFRVIWPDGSVHWLEARAKVFKDDRGKPVRIMGVNMDITARKLAEEALKDADRRKNEFLATLAHELRNPLSPILSAVELARKKCPEITELRWAVGVMERQIGHMSRLLEDLLDVSRITRNRLELRRAPITLAAVLEAALEISRPLADSRGHKIEVTLPPQPLLLDGDATRLAQVFANLLNNAAKYTDKPDSIRVTAEHMGDEVVVRVKDNGIGMAPEVLARVFEMFSQASAALDRSHGGLGIGLSLVKGIIGMHGGTVEARSEGLGKGAEFIVRLPLAGSAPVHNESAGEDKQPAPAGCRIVLADDNVEAAETMALILRDMGNDVRLAKDGQEAIDLAEAFRPDVVLLDIGMPRVNGYEAARRIREQPRGKNMILIAITGWGNEDDRTRSAEAGYDAHMIKPVTAGQLTRVIAELQAVRIPALETATNNTRVVDVPEP